MRIGGLQKLTLVDYPNKIAATIFLIGCNFKCGFCHNPDLVDIKQIKQRTVLRDRGLSSVISVKDVIKFLQEKKGLIDGVCITGGEPTINYDLPELIKKIKDLGFLVKLDTNGSNPEILEKLINDNLLDFIAMDIKTSIDVKIRNPKSEIRNYDKATGVKVNIEDIRKSVEIIKNSGIDYEFRTTCVPGVVNKDDIEKIGEWLCGSKKFALQQFRNQKVLDTSFEKIQPYPDETLEEFKKILERYIKRVKLRT